MMAAARPDRLQELERIERDIAAALQVGGQAVLELSKDKAGIRQAETHATNFVKTLQGIDTGLSKQIEYLTQVSTGQPHEGSVYAAQKDLQMAFHRFEHVKGKLAEMQRSVPVEHQNNPPTARQMSWTQ